MQRVPSTRAEWRATSHSIADEESGLTATTSLDVERGSWRWSVQRGAVVLDGSTASSESIARQAAERTLAWIRDRSEASASYRDAGIVCPNCGYVGALPPARGGDSAFRYLEDIIAHRSVGELHGQTLTIDGDYQTGDGYDNGKNPRLECRNCGCEFPVPPALSIARR